MQHLRQKLAMDTGSARRSPRSTKAWGRETWSGGRRERKTEEGEKDTQQQRRLDTLIFPVRRK